MIRLTAVIEVEGQSPRALTYESNARSVLLGRDANSDFQLPLATVSRQHARISEVDSLFTIEDLGSTHGTRLNGKPLVANQSKVLHNGDIIEVLHAKITCAIEQEKVASSDPFEGTQSIAARAVQGILGRLGEAQGDPYLRIMGGTLDGQRLNLGGGLTAWAMGRSAECELVIDDANVSRRHAMIRRDWQGYLIEDLGSKNGVLVGERAITRTKRLKNEDELTIGPIKMVFIDPDADLLAALKGVPGFEIDQPESPEPEGDSPADAQLAPRLSAVEERDGGPLAEPSLEPVEDEDELADLDPSLLEAQPERKQLEWALLAGAALLAILAGVGLWLVLS